MKLIVGLGNPEPDYINTRHNIGFLAADRIANHHRLLFTESRFKAYTARGTVFKENTIIAKPQTYMNLSGEAIGEIVENNDINSKDIIVIHDDMDIGFGRIKIKTRGGTAGHRGLESIIECLQKSEFTRVRVGIGKPEDNTSSIDYVLQNFTENENKLLSNILDNINECIEVLFRSGPEAAMNKFHTINNQTD